MFSNQQAAPQPQQVSNGVRIKYLLLVPTSERYADIFQRSFKLDANATTLQKLKGVFESNGIENNEVMPDNLLANTVPELVSLDTTTHDVAEIPNGWGTQRLRFLLVTESDFGGNTIRSYIQGFSEYYDPTLTGNIDDRMQFHINSITNVISMYNPVTGAYFVQPQETFNVISDLTGGSRYQEVMNEDLQLIRPTDIFETMYTIDKYGDGEEGHIIGNSASVGGKVNRSKRSNNNPMKWMSSVLNPYIEAKSISGIGYDTAGILKTAKTAVREGSVLSVPFIYALNQATGVITPTSFTLETIRTRIDPDIAAKTQIPEKAQQGYMHGGQTLDVADLSQPTFEVMTANMVSNGITSLMLDNLVTKLSVSMTNESGSNVVLISDIQSFIEGIDIRGYFNRVLANIKNIMMPEISKSGAILITVDVVADILGDTNISVSVNVGPKIPFRFPTYADSLFSPVVTNTTTRNGIINDFQNVLDATYASSAAVY